MQKATASAEEAGLSFEWLGTYIAVLSEKTRQAPESVGTALNSLMTRIHAIRKTGFNSEDETKISDVNQALASIGVTLMDQNGHWRDLNLVFDDVAAQWDTMTDKQKAYVSTTMAGTRQANYFKTLMQDLSKGVEGGSRAWELYEGAMSSAGTAMEKYAIWEESVQAAQNRLTAELEEFYALLSGDTVKGWYDILAKVVGGLNDATEASDGMNIKLALSAAAVTLLVTSLIKLKLEAGGAEISIGRQMIGALTGFTTTATGATVATNMLGLALRSIGVGMAIAAASALITWLIDLANRADEAAAQTAELAATLKEGFKQNTNLDKFSNELTALQSSTDKSSASIEAFNKLREEMIFAFPDMKDALGGEIKSVDELTAAYKRTTAAIEEKRKEQMNADWETAHSGVEAAKTTYNAALKKQSNARESSLAKEMQRLATGIDDELLSSYHTYANLTMQTMEGLEAQSKLLDAALDKTSAKIYDQAGALGVYGDSVEDVKTNLAMYIDEQAKLEKAADWGSDTRRTHQNNVGRAQEILLDIESYENYLYKLTSDVKPAIEQLQEEIATELRDSVTTLITDALNPYQFSDIPLNVLASMRQTLAEMDWGNATAQDVRDQAEALVTMYKDEYAHAMDLAGQIQAEGFSDDVVSYVSAEYKKMSKALKAQGQSEWIDLIWAPVRQALATVAAEAHAAEMVVTGDSMTSSPEDAQSQIEAALKMLDRLQIVRDAMNEFGKDGLLGADTIDNLREAFEKEFPKIFEPLTDQETWRDRLDQLWEGLATDDNMNLLRLFGLNIDDSGSVAEQLNEAIRQIAKAADKDAFMEIWKNLPEGIRIALKEAYPVIEDVLKTIEEKSAETEKTVEANMRGIAEAMRLDDAIQKGEAWSDLDDIMANLERGGEHAGSAVSALIGHMGDAATAMGALTAAQAGNEDALEHLANMTGFTAEQLKTNMAPAEYAVAEASNQAAWSATYLANSLYAAGAVSIDPSGKLAAIGSIEAAAEAAGMTVAQFAATLAALNGASFQLNMNPDGTGGVVAAKVAPVKWTGTKSSGSSRGSSGGGGGGSASVSKGVESLLDGIEKSKTLRDYRRELAQTAQTYHETRGEIQGVILYLEKEKEIVKENIGALEGYIASIEKEIENKQAAIVSAKEGSSAYKQAMLDLEALQEDHQEYSKELIENKTDVEKLTQAVKDQYDAIRQMEIDLRDTILEAIEDREEREERMLDGRIAMEEEIMDLLRERYEKERDEIIETQNVRKDALQEEIDQIDELLAARKKLAEDDERLQKIAELEGQIARISADPTRQKEAIELQQELNELREELAWDAAEKEAEAQKQSLEQQITSIEDYISYVEGYYEDLLNNPKKLMAEMQELLSGTDEQIMGWLQENSEEYQKATAAAQEQMRADWQETLDDMNGTVRTHWEEVEEVIAGGSDKILSFLKEHSADYKEAGKLQAEAYVDEWKKQLDDLEAAYKKVTGDIDSYKYTETKTSSSGSGGSGGSGSSGGSTKSTTTQPEGKYHKYEYKDADGNWVLAAHKNAIKQSALDATKEEAIENWIANGVTKGVATRRLRSSTVEDPGEYIRYVGKFKKGGMTYDTGLAWVDGTETDPERILNPYQTKLFEDLINTLHMIRTVNIKPAALNIPKLNEQAQGFNIEKIDVHVEKLENEQDYAAAAEKLMNEFYKKMNRTRAIGGIQTR